MVWLDSNDTDKSSNDLDVVMALYEILFQRE